MPLFEGYKLGHYEVHGIWEKYIAPRTPSSTTLGKSAFLGAAPPDVLESVVKNGPDRLALPPGTPVHLREWLARKLAKRRKQRLQAEARSTSKLPWAMTVAAIVFVLVLPALPMLAQSSPDDLRGIYIYTNDVSQITTSAANALTSSFNLPGVDGVAVVIGWDAIEPAMGQYQWTLLDQWINQVSALGKKIDLVVPAGSSTPAWLFQPPPNGAGAVELKFTVSPHNGQTGVCDAVNIAAPWDPSFLAQWDSMLAALSAHLKIAGTYNAITLVRLTGINRTTEELRLPAESAASTGLACVSNSIATWQQAGYRPSLLLQGWNAVLGSFMKSFPGKPFAVSIIPNNAFPGIAEDGSAITGQIGDENQPLLMSASQQLLGRLVVQFDFLMPGETASTEVTGAAQNLGTLAAFQTNEYLGNQGAGCSEPVTSTTPCTAATYLQLLETGIYPLGQSNSLRSQYIEVFHANASAFPADIEQAHLELTCDYALSLSGQAFTAQGGSGTVTINTGAGCPWSVGALPTGVSLTSAGSGTGNGSVTFNVLPNGNGSQSSSFTIAGQTFTIAAPTTGALAHFTAGGIWTTGFFVLNKASSAERFSIAFRDDNGNPVALPFSTGPTGTLSGTVAAEGSAYYEASNPQASVVGGSAEITADPSIVVQALFRENSSGTYYEAAVPSSSGSKEFLLPFDATTFAATGQPFYTGVAIANLDETTANVVCTARDSNGSPIPGAISVPALAPQGHWANYLFPALTNNRGTIDCVSNTNIAATAFRFIGTKAFSSLPVIANPANFSSGPNPVLPHFAAGDIWTTGFFVLNKGNSAAHFSIVFHDDNGGPIALPFSTGTANTLSGTVAARGLAYYEASNPQASVIGGSAQITADPSIVVQALFRENSSGTYYEAAVPSSSGSKEFLLPFDATTFPATGQPFYTGFAIVNLDATTSNVVCTARDSSGNIITGAIAVPPLAPQGHWANYLFPKLTGSRGTIDCVSNTNIAATALRFIGTKAFSSLPVITK